MIVDAVADGHDYALLEKELIADWREHLAARFAAQKAAGARALQWALKQAPPADAAALAELRQLEQRLAAA